MLVWLYHLPNTCIALLFGLTGTALFMGVLFLRIKLLRLDVQPDHAKAAHDALAVVIGFAGLILAVLRCFVWVTELSDGWDG
jgi:hypothetical protein